MPRITSVKRERNIHDPPPSDCSKSSRTINVRFIVVAREVKRVLTDEVVERFKIKERVDIEDLFWRGNGYIHSGDSRSGLLKERTRVQLEDLQSKLRYARMGKVEEQDLDRQVLTSIPLVNYLK